MAMLIDEIEIESGSVGEVIIGRATQETRGRLAQWSKVTVVIVFSGHRTTPQ